MEILGWFKRMASQVWLHILILAVLVGLFLVFGNRGVDFGTEWDEHMLIDSVANSLQTDTMVPGWYDYGSMSYDLIFAALGRRAVVYAVQNPPSNIRDVTTIPPFLKQLSANLLQRVKTRAFYLTVRKVFILVSALSLVWVYLFVYVWRKSKLEAALAAAILLGSWEFLYHSRWIAPNTIMAQFAIATFAFLMLAEKGKHWNFWIQVAAVAAGLAFATKYPGGLVLLPVLLAVALKKGVNRPVMALKALGVFAVTFYIISPGSFVQPIASFHDTTHQMVHYATGHSGYTVEPGLPYLGLLLPYLFAQVGSRFIPLALILSGFSLAGFVLFFREKSLTGWILAGFSLLYILYFSRQHVLTTQNFQILIPLFAIVAARGIVAAFQRIPWRLPQYAFAMAILAVLLFNFGWQWYSANSIYTGGPNRPVELAKYIREHPQEKFWLSVAAADELKPELRIGIKNIITDKSRADLFVINSDDISLKSITLWPANFIDFSVKTIGTEEINFNYNPSWSGKNRLVIMKPKYALPLMSIIEAPNP